MKEAKHNEKSEPRVRPAAGTPVTGIRALIRATTALVTNMLSFLWTGEPFSEQVPAWSTSLFAPSSQTEKEIVSRRALPFIRFYDEPLPIAAAGLGTLVRTESASDFALPLGVTATGALYHTWTANGTDALASGAVLVPYGQPSKEGWLLLAWCHGISGAARRYAASFMKSLSYDWDGLYQYVTLGYAAVATNCTGLTTAGPHTYLDIYTNAGDVINSVPAAHAAVHNLSQRWLVVGHSQGGLPSLGAAELGAGIKDPNFLGTVALAGASDPSDAIDSIQKVRLPVLNGLITFWSDGGKAVYPDFQPKDVLTGNALSIYEASVVDGCSAGSGAVATLPTNEMLLPGWRDSPYVKHFPERNRHGTRSTFGPLLRVGGGDGSLFDEVAERKAVERICAAGGHVQQKIYLGLGA